MLVQQLALPWAVSKNWLDSCFADLRSQKHHAGMVVQSISTVLHTFYGSAHFLHMIAQTETLQSTLKKLSKGRYVHQFVATICT